MVYRTLTQWGSTIRVNLSQMFNNWLLLMVTASALVNVRQARWLLLLMNLCCECLLLLSHFL